MAANDPTDLIANPLGTNNFYVGARNASDLDKVVNGAADWYTNRFGNNIRSLASLTNLYDQFQASFDALQTQFEGSFQSTLDSFNADSQAALNSFSTNSGNALFDFSTDSQALLNSFSLDSSNAITDFNADADTALARIAAFENTGLWSGSTAYTVNHLWQNPNDLTYYFVLNNYTSDATDVNVDISSGNVAVFAGATYNYSYTFINDVLGDKITYGPDFDDVDAYDTILGKVYEGTATAQDIAISQKVNNQLGIIAGA